MEEERPSIFDIDIGKDPDDTVVASMLALAPEKFRPVLIITNDEAKTKGRARYAAAVTVGSGIPVAAGLPSREKRAKIMIEEDSVFPAFDGDFKENGIKVLLGILEKHEKINYFGLGALTNLAAALRERPEFAPKINLIQMGPAFDKAYKRVNKSYRGSDAQYNIWLDVSAFRNVLEHVENACLLLSHASWGVYDNGRQEIGIYLDDPLYDALEASDYPEHKWCVWHLDSWKRMKGRDCSVMHDPLTVLSFFEPIVDYAKGDISIDDEGLADLTKDSHAQLKKLEPEGQLSLKDYLTVDTSSLVDGTLTKRVTYSLGADYDAACGAIVTALFGDRYPDLARKWREYNSSHPT